MLLWIDRHCPKMVLQGGVTVDNQTLFYNSSTGSCVTLDRQTLS